MTCPPKLALRLVMGVLLLGPVLWDQPCWSATAQVKPVLYQDQYPAGASYPIAFRVSVSPSWYLHGPKISEDGLIPTKLSFYSFQGLRIIDIRFPPPSNKKFEYTQDAVEVFSGQFLVRARLEVGPNTPTGSQEVKGELSYQACSARLCLPPENVPVSLFLSIVPPAANTTSPGVKTSGPDILESIPDWNPGAGLWLTLVGIFVGGLLLNLTPCVYPLIPITVSYFGGMAPRTQGRTYVQGLLYILGIAFTNSVLGLTASLSGSMLGAILQNPIVLVVVAGILAGLGLSFFGLWEFQLPSRITRLASNNFGGYFGTFFMGLTLGIVAAPCLGPFILGLLTYVGQKGDPFLGFLYFFILSIGLGLPLAILAIFTGGIKHLPRSGQWMVWIRKVFGWVLLAMAFYLLQPLFSAQIGKALPLAILCFVAGLHLGWLEKGTLSLRGFPQVKKGLGIGLICVGVILLLKGPFSERGPQWVPYDPAIVKKAAQAHKPVILDFYADWCGPCRAMDREVFTESEVLRLCQDIVAVRVDLTQRHPQQKALLEQYHVRGVPTIIFINRKGIEERALRIVSFAGRDEVIKRMKTLLMGKSRPHSP